MERECSRDLKINKIIKLTLGGCARAKDETPDGIACCLGIICSYEVATHFENITPIVFYRHFTA